MAKQKKFYRYFKITIKFLRRKWKYWLPQLLILLFILFSMPEKATENKINNNTHTVAPVGVKGYNISQNSRAGFIHYFEAQGFKIVEEKNLKAGDTIHVSSPAGIEIKIVGETGKILKIKKVGGSSIELSTDEQVSMGDVPMEMEVIGVESSTLITVLEK